MHPKKSKTLALKVETPLVTSEHLIFTLPLELLRQIAVSLNPEFLLNFSKACKLFQSISHDRIACPLYIYPPLAEAVTIHVNLLEIAAALYTSNSEIMMLETKEWFATYIVREILKDASILFKPAHEKKFYLVINDLYPKAASQTAIVKELSTIPSLVKANSQNLHILCDTILNELDPLEHVELFGIIRDLIDISDLDFVHKDGVTAMHRACFMGNVYAVKALLSHIPDLELKDTKRGETALHKAVKSGSCEIVELLLAAGADCDARNKNGRTAFCEAALSRNADIASILYEYGADPSTKDSKGHPLLHQLIMKNDIEALRFMVDAWSIDLTVKDRKGNTALHKAVAMNREDIISILFNAGVKIDCTNNAGDTPLDIACNKYFDEIEEMIVLYMK